MSITFTADVFCDVCGDWANGVTFHWETKAQGAQRARQKVKPEGWLRVKAQGRQEDLCPSCAKTLEEGQ